MDIVYETLKILITSFLFQPHNLLLLKKPIFNEMDITEIPCNAYLDNPSQIIDGWSSNVDLSITPKVMLEGIKSYLFFRKKINCY